MTKWTGEVDNCDICTNEFADTFIDGATVDGPWALMCIECWELYGIGLGIGRGQMYDLKTKVKIEG